MITRRMAATRVDSSCCVVRFRYHPIPSHTSAEEEADAHLWENRVLEDLPGARPDRTHGIDRSHVDRLQPVGEQFPGKADAEEVSASVPASMPKPSTVTKRMVQIVSWMERLPMMAKGPKG